MPKQTFAERAAQMHEAAMELRNIAELVLLEAQRMDASQARFAAQKTSRPHSKTEDC